MKRIIEAVNSKSTKLYKTGAVEANLGVGGMNIHVIRASTQKITIVNSVLKIGIEVFPGYFVSREAKPQPYLFGKPIKLRHSGPPPEPFAAKLQRE